RPAARAAPRRPGVPRAGGGAPGRGGWGVLAAAGGGGGGGAPRGGGAAGPRPPGPRPPLVAVDLAEAATRLRLPSVEEPLASAAEMGFALEQGGAPFELVVSWLGVARQLAAMGVNFCFGPVLDLGGPGSPRGEGECFGESPELVATAGAAAVDALSAAGLVACGQGFPGRGLGPGAEPATADDLEGRDGLPFAAAISHGLDVIQLATGLYPAWDPKEPAFRSQAVLSDRLRGALGFDGVAVSPDLGIGFGDAADGAAALRSTAEGALAAGCDLLVVGDPEAQGALLDARHPFPGPDVAVRWREAAQRVTELRDDWLVPG
ncbi:MAG: glycoside hydrolase family 3 N-terminal domain-containing protein, partial [Acidobacteriota bacterium]